MPEINNPNFPVDMPKEGRLPLLGEPLLTPGTVERLQIPDEVALRPENVLLFLRGETVRYHDIVQRPEIKALEADIPEYLHIHAESTFLQSHPADLSVTAEEREALNSWFQELETSQKGGEIGEDDLERITGQIDADIEEMKKRHPELFEKKKDPGDVGDVFEMMYVNEIVNETEEEKRKWHRLLAVAAASGDPELFNTYIGMRYAHGVTKKIGRLVKMYKFHLDNTDQIVKAMEQESKGDPSQFKSEQFSMKFSQGQGNILELNQLINKAMTDYQRITVDTAQTNTQIGRPREVMINNMKVS